MRLLLIPAYFSLILFFTPFHSNAQLIKERFDKLSISENFDSINTYWTTMANAENLFIVQDGEYILQRKSPTAPYAVIANFEESFRNFRAIASIKLDKTTGEEAFGGFLFMMQSEGEGGFLFEINKNKEFRIRQIVNGVYKYLTGNSKTGGWIRSAHLNESSFSNMVEVRNLDRNYDIYINHNYIQSFSEPAYKSGKMGLIVGPSSRCKVDFMYVFTMTMPEASTIPSPTDATPAPVTAGPDIIELTESIIRLKTQINTLTEENEELNKTISAMNSGDQEKDVTIKNLEKQLKKQQDDLTKKDRALDSIIKVNSELMKYKELAGGNENADLIIVLSKSLKAEKEKNTQLEQEIKELKAKNGTEKTTPKSPVKTTKPDTGSSGTNENTKKETNIFKLPED